MRELVLAAALPAVIVGCAPEDASTDLVRGAVRLDQRTFVITPRQPLPARGLLPGLCVGAPPGYKLLAFAAHDAGAPQPPLELWSALLSPDGDTVRFGGTIALVSGEVHPIALVEGFMRGDACLLVQPPEHYQNHPLPAAVREIHLWSNTPITVPRIYWRESIS